jgi:hypothetical protein
MMRRVLPLVVLVAAANFVMLVLAQANRSVPVDALRLTERELSREVTTDRDSAIRLRLNYVNSVSWEASQNEPTMIALGFRCGPRAGSPMGTGTCGLARRAFAALEYEGPAWREWVARRQEERERARPDPMFQAAYFDSRINSGPRLVMIDASLDPIALRRAHPERNVLILPATARAWLNTDVLKPSGGAVIAGSVTLVTWTLVVPARARGTFATIPAPRYGLAGPPRYIVDLRIGGRHEPWIQDVQPIDPPGAAR